VRLPLDASAAGTSRIMARATNAKGQTQETEQWNRSGYARTSSNTSTSPSHETSRSHERNRHEKD